MNFQFLKPDGTQKVMGFYLEGVNDKGVIGPVVEFHPMHDDMFTAWSYNFHLFRTYFLIYQDLRTPKIHLIHKGIDNLRCVIWITETEIMDCVIRA